MNEKTLSFKRGRRIQDAIELVIERELGKVHQQDILIKAMKDVRNSTAHTDLNSDEPEPQETYYRWQACQFLVEAILLSQLGLKEIPNRTVPMNVQILGEDVSSDARSCAVQLDTGQ